MAVDATMTVATTPACGLSSSCSSVATDSEEVAVDATTDADATMVAANPEKRRVHL